MLVVWWAAATATDTFTEEVVEAEAEERPTIVRATNVFAHDKWDSDFQSSKERCHHTI